MTTATSAVSTPPTASTASQRVVSVDALRGFDMFWIVGGEWIVEALKEASPNPVTNFLSRQLEHVQWEGFHFYDLIFPMFVFIIGVSLVFSLTRIIEREGRGAAMRRILRRGVLLYLLGILYYGGFSTRIDQIRLLGVLQRLALCYTFAGLAFCCFGTRGLVACCVGLLIGYWALVTFVPVPGVGAGHFEEGKNLTNYIDREYLPWRKWDGDHDPEGLLSTLPAIGNCLLGVFAGLLLKNVSIKPPRKAAFLLGAGVCSILLGYAWGLEFPIIKKIWTSSYVLVVAGWSSVLLGVFYTVIDIWKVQKWATPFIWIGMNAITIYILHELLDFKKVAERFVGGDIQAALNRAAPGLGTLLVVLLAVGLTFAVVRFLYQRKVFLRL
jgi:predicted acyltransferase